MDNDPEWSSKMSSRLDDLKEERDSGVGALARKGSEAECVGFVDQVPPFREPFRGSGRGPGIADHRASERRGIELRKLRQSVDVLEGFFSHTDALIGDARHRIDCLELVMEKKIRIKNV